MTIETKPDVRLSEAEEEKIEALFWTFDSYRKHGSERDAFKGCARRLIRETKREAAGVAKHMERVILGLS